MYPLEIHGITGESIKRFMFNNDANERTMMQLVSEIPPEMQVVFYDQDYPSPSDPGAFVAFKKDNNQYSMQRSNHGWSNNWENVTVGKLTGYLSQCSKYNMGPESPNAMFAHFELSNPSQIEHAIQYYEKEIATARDAGDLYKEADAHADIGDIFLLRINERALEYYEHAVTLYREIGERYKEATALGNMAIIYSKLRQYEKAIEIQQKQVQIFEETGHFFLEHERRVLARYQKIATKKWWQFWK